METRTKAAADLITIGHDGEAFVLGRPDLGVYVAVPEPGAVFIRELQATGSVASATAKATESAGADVDGAEFLQGLEQAGLLEPPAGAGGERGGIRWIEGVSQRTAARLFGRTAWLLYGGALAVVLAILALRPDLRPYYEHAWWLPDPILSVLALVPLGLLIGGLHEMWHWLAGRAEGVPAIFRVSNRGIYVVFETDLTQIVSIPRRRRYGAFLAGMALDTVVMAVALSLRLLNRTQVLALPGLLDRLLAAVVLTQFFAIGWQFFAVFMRSDMYAVLANALRCHDLYRATWLTAKDRLWRLNPEESAELAAASERDRKVAEWFGAVYLAGIFVMVWLMLLYGLPFAISMIVWVGSNLVRPDLGTWAFWSSALVAALVVGTRVAPLLLAARERRLRLRGRLR
ncbi:hypothetical protein OIE66_03635 [Nonomuraea sp. NBC_01738]|uniref:hypothetical protein n=1 Tax=Nonomuraea sp. NBC_01738 TaxID=2976003 RepID=UPI002E0D85B0|nr:hypothetical protein OIE66_03635 [Nonomuraea sp. NBC_01738]